MRQIGTLADEDHARRFEDYALTHGIRTRIEQEDGRWAVWVYDEDQVAQGKEELESFRDDPDDERYVAASRAAVALRRQDEERIRQHRRNTVNVPQQWNRPLWMQVPAAYALIVISVLVALVSTDFQTPLRFCDKMEPVLKYFYIVPGEAWAPQLGLEAIQRGQIWRLFTPMFIHFGPFHLLFNSLWIRDLGAAVERNRGTLRFIALVLVIAAISNLVQYFWRGPAFGGLSGVVFGLFGYVWMKSRFDPASGFFMPPNLVFFMLLYLAITLFGALNIPIAHGAHLGGLAVGAAIGYAGSLGRRRPSPPR